MNIDLQKNYRTFLGCIKYKNRIIFLFGPYIYKMQFFIFRLSFFIIKNINDTFIQLDKNSKARLIRFKLNIPQLLNNHWANSPALNIQ